MICINALLPFTQAAEIVYLEFEIILFGLDILTEDEDTREVVLFPKKYKLKSSDIGLVIAEDISIAEKVSKYGIGHGYNWSSNLCSKKGHASKYRDTSLIHDVRKRWLKNNKFDYVSDSSGSGKRRERQRQGPSFGMMSSGHRAELQTQLREIVCASTIHEPGPDTSLVALQEARDKGCNQEENNKEKQKVYSLQEAVDLITQWPPLKAEKPDYPVLRKRAGVIQKNLDERTLTLVDLDKPHVLLCIQGKWPANLFCFVAQLRTPFLPKPPIVIMHPLKPSAEDWGCVGMFNDVYFVLGSPIYEIDLVRAGVLQAGKSHLLTCLDLIFRLSWLHFLATNNPSSTFIEKETARVIVWQHALSKLFNCV